MSAPRSLDADRVRKLLALAEDQRGTPEGEAAARLALRLLRRSARRSRGWDEDTRASRDPVQRRSFPLAGRVRWRRRVAAAVARHCACIYAHDRASGRAWIFGHTSDLAVAEYLTVVFMREIAAARETFERELPPDLDAEARARRVLDFGHSAALALESRLASLRQEGGAADPEGTALVRWRGDEVRSWMKERGVALRGAPDGGFAYSPEGYAAGWSVPMHDAVQAASAVGIAVGAAKGS